MMPLTPQTPSNELRMGMPSHGINPADNADLQMALAMLAKFTASSGGTAVTALAFGGMVRPRFVY